MLMDTPDEMLATAAAQGDRAAFAVLVGRHYDRIHGLAWRLTGAKAEAEDLTQDIFPLLEARGIALGRSRLWIEAQPCPAAFAADLAIQPGEAVLHMSRLTSSALDRPVDYEHLYCRGDSYQYKVELRRHPY